MEGTKTSGSALERTGSYAPYISLLSDDSDTDDESLQSDLLASYHQQESVPKAGNSSK